ncbi:MAG: hypothetical protein H7138_23090 [Myxococcales bacterium]|nr:hypothetical protein [Myxococcales bacterium]
MLRFLVYVAIAIGLVWFATQVPIGKRTFVGHVRAIWQTEEVQELKDGVKEKAAPAVERIERGVKAGYHAATDGSADVRDAGIDAPLAVERAP